MGPTPRRLGKYELQQQIGKGNVGEVWKARDLSTRQDVAIKILHSDFQSDSHFMERFTHTGPLIAALEHPNIVRVHEVNISRSSQTNETTAYIAMDYIEHTTLAQYIHTTTQRGQMPSVADITYLFSSIGAAVDYAHQHGLVCGTLKPGNILLNQQRTTSYAAGEPMLTDIGIAQVLGSIANAGSPLYISPEQASGYPVTNSSDMYALGIILYEICTGVPPFRGENMASILMQHINTLPTPPILINPAIPPDLSEVILRAMAKDPTMRFPYATTLAYAIAEACSGQSSLRSARTALPAPTVDELPSNPGKAALPILGVSQPLPPLQSMNIQSFQRPQLRLPANQKSLPGLSASAPVPLPRTTNPSLPIIPASPTSTPPSQGTEQAASSRPVKPLPATRSINTQPNVPAIPAARPSIPPINQAALIPTTPTQRYPAPVETNLPPATPISSPSQPPMLPPYGGSSLPQTPPQLALLASIRRDRSRFNINDTPIYIVIGVLLLLLVVLGTTIGINLLHNNTARVSTRTTTGHVFFQDDALGRNDQLRINMQYVANPPDGQTYFAWLQNTSQQFVPLGAMNVTHGTIDFTYMGDGHHTNLLTAASGFLITLEKAGSNPTRPADNKAYQATFASATLPFIKNILCATPNTPGNAAVISTIFETIKSMNDKAVSIVDSLQGTHDTALARRQATRILEMIDGTQYVRSSGDLPADVPDMATVPLGLISFPSHPGYLTILSQQLDQIKQAAGDDKTLLQHVQNIQNAIADLQGWLQKIRSENVQIVKAANLADPAILGVALQQKQAAADSYTGHTVPPNADPDTTLGSAGALQAYNEAQYMASLTLKAA